MKKIQFWVLSSILLLVACQLEEANINPNVPVEVPLQTLLPPAQQRTAEIHAGDAALIAGIFTQYFTGFDALVQPLDRYIIDKDFFMRPIWEDFYTDAMATCGIMIEQATREEAPHYRGIARILLAQDLGLASSLWGDLPYSEAFQGPANLNPAYDAQEEIYEQVQVLLDAGISDLEAETSELSPSSDDLIYGGDLEAWIRAAYTLKARFYLHTVKRNPGAADLALAALEKGITASEADMAYRYSQAEFNPWYQYLQSTPNIRVDAFFTDLIDEDPREDFYLEKIFGEVYPGPYIADPFTPLPLVTFVEAKCIEAECLLRTNADGAQEALEAAVRASMEQVGNGEIEESVIDDYLAAHAVLSGDFTADLALVMMEKYLALFTQIETWSDYRRTGFPELPPNVDGDHAQNPGGAIPRRFPYPLNEELYNANAPSPSPNLQDRFWWDQ